MYWKDWCWSSNTLATWCEELTHWKDPDAGKDWRQEEKRMTDDEMVGCHHQLNGQQTLRDGEGQGSLECYSWWGLEELDTTWYLNDSNSNAILILPPTMHEFVLFHTLSAFVKSLLKILASQVGPPIFKQKLYKFTFSFPIFLIFFKLYNIVLVLPNIEMNLPQVYIFFIVSFFFLRIKFEILSLLPKAQSS